MIDLRALAWYPARWTIAAGGAARETTTRAAILVRATAADGRVGLGEAAPLPGVSIDTLADVARDLAAIAATLPGPIDVATIASPAARFAIESALADLDDDDLGPPRTAVVADAPGDGADAAAIKVKLAPETIERAHAIARAAAPGTPIRLDGNRTFAPADVAALIARFADVALDYVEEPCPDAWRLADPRVALDESLAIDGAARARDRVAVIKPTVVGGLAAARAIAAGARRAIVTHALEGPIGHRAVVRVARALAPAEIHGLGPHGGVRDYPAALSITAAATEVPRAPAVIDADGRAWSFAELARRARLRGPARATIAHGDIDTLATIAAALDLHVPIGLVHHRATADEQARQLARLAAAPALPPDAAAILFTSGSTGAPRGVVLTRAALAAAALAHAAHLPWRDGDRWLLALSLAHAGGLAIAVRCLAARAPIVIAPDGDARALAATIAARRVTLASLVPTQLAALLDDPAWHPPAHLRAVLLGGAAAPPALIAAAVARGVPVLPTYGMTETFGQVATARPGDPARALVALPGVTLTAGRAGIPAPIAIATAQLAAAYLEPDGTLAPIAAPFVTRDLGTLDDALAIAGRADDVIITGGENVHPLAVEAAALATPGVRAALAFAVADARWGEVVGLALVVDPATFDRATALAAWHAALPAFARPRRLALVDALPQLPSGKLDRRAAATLATAPIEYAS